MTYRLNHHTPAHGREYWTVKKLTKGLFGREYWHDGRYAGLPATTYFSEAEALKFIEDDKRGPSTTSRVIE